MAVAAVVGHEIDQHPQAVVVGAGNERVRLLESAEVRMDIAIVADVVPTVGQRGRIPRADPERIDAELGEVGQSVDDAEDVSGAIVIVVGERPRIDLVNDGAAPPIGLTGTGHARILGPAGRAKAGMRAELVEAPSTGSGRITRPGSALLSCGRGSGCTRLVDDPFDPWAGPLPRSSSAAEDTRVASSAPARTVRSQRAPSRSGSLLPLLSIGAVCGLAWAASLRGFMTQIAGPESAVSWSGTFGWILAPGVATGVLLGWAEYIRRTGGRRGWRWLALAPLLFAGVLLPGLLDPATMFEGGIGGGAIGVPLFGMAGGYALSGRGPVVARIGCGVLFLTMIPIWALTVTSFGGPGLAVDTPRGLWVALYYWSLLVVLALACSIPHRPVIISTASPNGVLS